jgi:hypothetical protein
VLGLVWVLIAGVYDGWYGEYHHATVATLRKLALPRRSGAGVAELLSSRVPGLEE